ncbi:hypothetical protein BKA58DRAFT_447839 [Alternaria rosae]|uniref:uncharacterized protein n=1 Tax=Alternaria rosae TaxID=1187941 RepID=UPI001E8CC5B5|nr:uncharacterized protein BKA58DRAFT_447839 [Alternaria rosae]KAH6883120.1 hypothetical protein BKA58DRAFT_447839 [Alternaria rosae]
MSSFTYTTSEHNRMWISGLRQWINISGLRPNVQIQQTSMPQLPPAGIAATNCFSSAFIRKLQRWYQPESFGAQKAARHLTPRRQQQRGIMDVSTNSLCVELTRNDDREVFLTPPATPDVPLPAASTPAPTPTAQEAVQGVDLPTPDSLPPRTPTPSAPSHLKERLQHLRKSLPAHYCESAFRLLASFEKLDKKWQRKYCALFWASDEEALEDMHDMADLSPNASIIYCNRISWHSEEQKIANMQDPIVKWAAECELGDRKAAVVAKLKGECKLVLQDLRDKDHLAQLHNTIGNTKGQKSKSKREAQKEGYEEEAERVKMESEERWRKLNGELGSKELSVSSKRKRSDGVAPVSAPVPKKNKSGDKAVKESKKRKRQSGDDEDVVPKVPKRRGRPPKAKPVVEVQEPTPDTTNNEEDDDDAFGAALLAGFEADTIDEGVEAGTPCQLQEREEDSAEAVETVEDLLGNFSEVSPAVESVLEVASVPLENGEEDDMESLFEDDVVAMHAGNGMASLFGDETKADDAAEGTT